MESSGTFWPWKTEPVSPPHLSEDTWLFEDDTSAADDPLTLTAFKQRSAWVKEEHSFSDPDLDESSSSEENKAEVYSKLLDDLDHLDQLEDFINIKEEHFSNWLEEKVDLPIFEDIRIEPVRGYTLPVPLQQQQQQQPRFKTEELKTISHLLSLSHNIAQHQQVQQQHGVTQQQQQQQDTTVLLQEFETVFGAVELTHGQLTPPQSPPLTDERVLTPLTPITTSQGIHHVQASAPVPVAFVQQVAPAVYYHHLQQERVPSSVPVDLAPGTPLPDVAHELAVVDELVRTRAENMVQSWENSAETSTNCNVLQSPSSPSSSSSSGYSEYSSDPEWIPEPVQHTTSEGELVDRPARGRKRAGKPYSRIGPEDKKSRKKEQNKNAATRYRQKKKAEIEEILTEEKQLADDKSDLQAKVSDLQREIKCLKGLMRDLFKAKGLIQ